MWNVKENIDISNNRGNWNHLYIIQKIPDQRSGKARHQELQKIAMLGTVHIFGKVVMWKYKMFIMVNSITCSINFNCRIAETPYRSLNATMAQLKNCPFELITTIERRSITAPNNNDICWAMFLLTSVPVLWDVVDISLSSAILWTPNGKFFSCASIAFSERYALEARFV